MSIYMHGRQNILYPEEFRKKVLEYIDGFYTQVEVAKMFKISPKTVWSWVNQRKKTGNLKPKVHERKAIKLEVEALTKYIREHPDAYLKEIAEHFGCVVSAVYQRLKKLKITLKKKHFYIKKEMKRNATHIKKK
jgi:transposase